MVGVAGIVTILSSLLAGICSALSASSSLQLQHASYTHTALALEDVLDVPGRQLTGVAVSSRSGRVFVNFPRWSANASDIDGSKFVSVAEAEGQILRPYPDAAWNAYSLSQPQLAGQRLVCVQAVYIDRNDFLYIVDAASPFVQGIVPGGPKVVRVDLRTDRIVKVYHLDLQQEHLEQQLNPHESVYQNVVLPDSYLNDIVVDVDRNVAYLTDSGAQGAIIVLDLDTGRARRVLSGAAVTLADPRVDKIVIEGKRLQLPDGSSPRINSDGIALTPDGNTLYFQQLTGRTLHRVETSMLRNESLSSRELEDAVVDVCQSVVTDGMAVDRLGRVYFTALELNSIVRYDPHDRASFLEQEGHDNFEAHDLSRQYSSSSSSSLLRPCRLHVLAHSKDLHWPDSFSLVYGEDEHLKIYFSTSQINLGAQYNGGVDKTEDPYRIWRIDG